MGAVVLLSGGQDSSTCLHWALADWAGGWNPEDVVALHLSYGQRHAIERECATVQAALADVPLEDLELGGLLARLAPSALLAEHGGELRTDAGDENPYAAARNLPSSFVPGRNVFLIAAAAVWGAVRGHTDLVVGICQEDDAGYPDCRREFALSIERTLKAALDLDEFCLHTPLIDRTKAETWFLADQLGVLRDIVANTHTCYTGDREKRHDWGYGCGECPACQTREAGFKAYRKAEARARLL